MHLSLDKSKCNSCQEIPCLDYCPKGLQSTSALQCQQCDFHKAECVKACPENAFIEIAKGIIGIDYRKCKAVKGCRKCLKACPHQALELIQGKPVKCDLCAENNFVIACLKACPEQAIALQKTEKEVKAIENVLGWYVQKINPLKVKKILMDSPFFQIIEARENEKIYAIKDFPELTLEEAKLIQRVFQEFKSHDSKEVSPNKVKAILKSYCQSNLIELDEEQENYLHAILNSLVFGFGPITSLLENDCLEEIAIIGTGKEKPVYVFEKNFGWLKTNACYSNEKAVKDLINKMARGIGRRVSLQTPKLNAILADGSRINAVVSPASFTGPSLTVRKFRRKPFTPLDLLKHKTFSAESLAFLWLALQTDSSLIIAGNTGSGKTTSLNALFCFVPENERIIVTEETPELNLPHQHLVKLKVVPELGLGMNELIEDTLRMRPDRVIVGEIRNQEETSAFMDTLLAGQGKGSYATFHALSADEALKRFKNLGLMEMDLSALDLIVVQKRWTKIDSRKKTRQELRRVIEIAEVIEGKNNAELNPLFEYDFKKDCLKKSRESQKVCQKIMNTFSLTKKQLEKELRKRKKLLEKARAETMPAFIELVGKNV